MVGQSAIRTAQPSRYGSNRKRYGCYDYSNDILSELVRYHMDATNEESGKNVEVFESAYNVMFNEDII